MSSSATSAADTDSSILSRGEKRSLTPSESPQPKRSRANDHSWEVDSTSSQAPNGSDDKSSVDGDHSKVQLPSIFTTFEDSFHSEHRRASLPTSIHESRARHSPYPPTSLRQTYSPANQSSLSSYTFPPTDDSSNERGSNRPRLSTDLGLGNSYESPYSNSGLSNGTTPSTSTFPPSNFGSPMSPEYGQRQQGLSAYPDSDNWNSPAGIVRPSSTPGQFTGPGMRYEEGLRHSFSAAPMSQAHMFAGSARISGQHERRAFSSAGIKTEWSFPSPDFVLPSGAPSYPSPSMSNAPPSISVSNSPSRSPQSVPTSAVERPQRKRGKLPKETTDYLKAWLHRHSDHPYPSEEEKKQLCHATGLSMSQVSNWMINVSTFQVSTVDQTIWF